MPGYSSIFKIIIIIIIIIIQFSDDVGLEFPHFM